MSEYPGVYLLAWCRNLPQDHGLCLAHLYLISTAQDMTPLFLEGEGIWREFQNQLLRQDIPLRMAVRVSTAIATLDFLLGCLAAGAGASFGGDFVRHPNPHLEGAALWSKILESLDELKSRLCGPEHMAAWLRQALAAG